MSKEDPSLPCDCQDKLAHAEKEIDNLLGNRLGFLSTVSHEIRTPLNAIIGISDLLQQPTSDEQQQEYFQILKQTSETLLELVNNVLDFSKINLGNLKVLNKVFDLRATINRSLYGERIKARGKNLELEVCIDPDLPEFIIGDSVKVGQVFMNLVSNAIKFTDEGKVSLKVEVVTQSEEQVRLRCAVSDTGIGIPENQMENIFEAFNQGSEDINIRYAGTGLGLSISQRVIAMLGGELKVQSIVGAGSEFSFCLDFQTSSVSENENPPLWREDETSARGIRLLLVEDNKINVLVAEKYLRKWGVDLDIAHDGKKAFEMVQQKDHDIVLMDLHMPIMDGFTAARLIRELPHEKFRKLPIIALTAASEHFFHERIQLTGFTDFMNKPFHPEALLGKIVSHVRLELVEENAPGLEKR